jgi:DNA polymerase III delta prime subunit
MTDIDNTNITWLDKYKIRTFEECKGYEIIKDIMNKWISVFVDKKNWYPQFKNGILLSGKSGVGKSMLAELLMNKWNYEIVEFNSLKIKTNTTINEKLESILSTRSITDIYNNINTGIIIDKLDGMDPKKECSLSDIIDYLNYNKRNYIEKLKIHNRKNKIKMSDTEINRIIKTKRFINNCPIILITNELTHSIQSLSKDVIHIEIPSPTNEDIYELMKYIRDNESFKLNNDILKICIPYCQNDYRRVLNLMELLYHSFKDNNIGDINDINIIKWLNSYSEKDLDMNIEYVISNVYYNNNLTWNCLINMYYVDESFVPLIIHENFTDMVPNNISYKEQLDICIEYYENMYQSLVIKTNVFGHWEEFNDYIGIFSTVSANSILKKYMNDDRKYETYRKSAMISKYNYRYYNMKFINYICKKISMDIDNFAIFSCLLYYSVFINMTYLKEHLLLCASYKLTFKELEKTLKLSILYDEKKYNKRKCKELTEMYIPMIIDLDIEDEGLIF